MLGSNPAIDTHPVQGGLEILLIASCHGNRDKLRSDEPLGSYADFTDAQRTVKGWTRGVEKDKKKQKFTIQKSRTTVLAGFPAKIMKHHLDWNTVPSKALAKRTRK